MGHVLCAWAALVGVYQGWYDRRSLRQATTRCFDPFMEEPSVLRADFSKTTSTYIPISILRTAL